MTPHQPTRRALFALTAAGLMVSACANGPTAPKSAPAPVDPNYGKMAPIPNPTDEAPRPAPRPAPRSPETPATRPPGPIKPPVATQPKVPATPGRDPARAKALRAQGLEQLNRGAIDKAQDLLRQALALDPSNALIQRDLDRANRIGRAVRAKP